jgi:hypothetical protein
MYEANKYCNDVINILKFYIPRYACAPSEMKSVWEEELYFSYGYVSGSCCFAMPSAFMHYSQAAFYNALDAGVFIEKPASPPSLRQ